MWFNEHSPDFNITMNVLPFGHNVAYDGIMGYDVLSQLNAIVDIYDGQVFFRNLNTIVKFNDNFKIPETFLSNNNENTENYETKYENKMKVNIQNEMNIDEKLCKKEKQNNIKQIRTYNEEFKAFTKIFDKNFLGEQIEENETIEDIRNLFVEKVENHMKDAFITGSFKQIPKASNIHAINKDLNMSSYDHPNLNLQKTPHLLKSSNHKQLRSKNQKEIHKPFKNMNFKDSFGSEKWKFRRRKCKN